MHVQTLTLQNFRNFQSLDLKFNQGFVVLVGPNGAGKTNFLESIYFGGGLGRFPETGLDQLFMPGERYFKIQITTQNTETTVHDVYCEQREGKRVYRFMLNSQPVPRNKYLGLLPVVSFLPQDLNLLTRSPGNRRRYLDETLSPTSAEYRFALGRYEGALRQRNELWQNIKLRKAAEEELEVWDDKLAEHGSVITTFRQKLFDYLDSHFSQAVEAFSPELAQGKFVYQSSGYGGKPAFLEKVRAARARERQIGSTVVGPHRDDFEIVLSGRSAVGFVSRGQMRGFTLGLKILERQYLSERLAVSPVVILDDVFSEFDQAHQRRLIEFLKSLNQVFFTTTHLEEIKSFLPEDAQIYNIDNGVILERSTQGVER